MDYTDRQYIYAAGVDAVYRSEDFGKTWSVVLSDE